MGFFSSGGFGKLLDPGDVLGYGARQQAGEDVRGGYQQARAHIAKTYPEARKKFRSEMEGARGEARTGFKKAQAYYDTPGMVASREELFNRVLGKGGYSPETLESMKAGAREEAGTSLRGAQQSLQSYYGDAGAQGMAGENLARAATDIGAARAGAIRDIDVGQAMLKEEQQTGAIRMQAEEAAARAGLSARETELLSDISVKLASGEAQLTTDEAALLAQLAAAEGTAMAGTRNTGGLLGGLLGGG